MPNSITEASKRLQRAATSRTRFSVAGMVVTLLQQCRFHKNRVRLSAGIARHIVFDKNKGDHLLKE